MVRAAGETWEAAKKTRGRHNAESRRAEAALIAAQRNASPEEIKAYQERMHRRR